MVWCFYRGNDRQGAFSPLKGIKFCNWKSGKEQLGGALNNRAASIKSSIMCWGCCRNFNTLEDHVEVSSQIQQVQVDELHFWLSQEMERPVVANAGVSTLGTNIDQVTTNTLLSFTNSANLWSYCNLLFLKNKNKTLYCEIKERMQSKQWLFSCFT